MYQNYNSLPYYTRNFSSSSSMPSYNTMQSNQSNRLAGGFLGPFILGGITGGLVAPAFYGGYNRPYYNNNYYYPYQYPYSYYY